MSEPEDWVVLSSLQTALAAISVDAGDNVTVEAVKLDPASAVDVLDKLGTVMAVVPSIDRADVFEELPGKRVRCQYAFDVHAFVRTSLTDDAAKALAFARVTRDIERALWTDRHRGGIATNTQIVGRRNLSHDQDVRKTHMWAVVTVVVTLTRAAGV